MPARQRVSPWARAGAAGLDLRMNFRLVAGLSRAAFSAFRSGALAQPIVVGEGVHGTAPCSRGDNPAFATTWIVKFVCAVTRLNLLVGRWLRIYGTPQAQCLHRPEP